MKRVNVCSSSVRLPWKSWSSLAPAVGINLLAHLHRALKQTPELPTWQKIAIIGVRAQFKCKCAVFIHVGQIGLIFWASWRALGRYWWSRWFWSEACDVSPGFKTPHRLYKQQIVTQIKTTYGWQLKLHFPTFTPVGLAFSHQPSTMNSMTFAPNFAERPCWWRGLQNPDWALRNLHSTPHYCLSGPAVSGYNKYF